MNVEHFEDKNFGKQNKQNMYKKVKERQKGKTNMSKL